MNKSHHFYLCCFDFDYITWKYLVKLLLCLFSSWTCVCDLEGLSMRHLWRPGKWTHPTLYFSSCYGIQHPLLFSMFHGMYILLAVFPRCVIIIILRLQSSWPQVSSIDGGLELFPTADCQLASYQDHLEDNELVNKVHCLPDFLLPWVGTWPSKPNCWSLTLSIKGAVSVRL